MPVFHTSSSRTPSRQGFAGSLIGLAVLTAGLLCQSAMAAEPAASTPAVPAVSPPPAPPAVPAVPDAPAAPAMTAEAPPPPAPPAAPAGPRVALKTNMGEIVLELNAEKAPKTTANFLSYVKDGFYSGTVFHRVIPGFMIQGGGFTPNMQQKSTRKPIENEAKNGLKNDTYTIAMARTGDPHSASSQFFINVTDNGMLNYPGRDGWGYAVFGKVIKGFDVVDKIKGVPTGNVGPFQNVPNEPVLIEKATLLK